MSDDNSSNVTTLKRRAKDRPQPRKLIAAAEHWELEPEPTEFLVDGAVPLNSVCLYSGDSGLGKTLTLQQLMFSCANGMPWMGMPTRKCRSLALFCEDPWNILHQRQKAIGEYHDLPMPDVDDITYMLGIGEDNVLVRFNQKTNLGSETYLFEQLMTRAVDLGVQLVIIDTLAHTYAGNENNREQVTAFCAALQRIATAINGAVILSSHPSVTSMASGTGFSGSTAWRATVRAHMYLKRPKGYDDESPDADHDARILKTMKSNWTAGGGMTKLRWDRGVFIPVDADLLDGDEPTARLPIKATFSGLSHTSKLDVERKVIAVCEETRRRGLWINPRTDAADGLFGLNRKMPGISQMGRHMFNAAQLSLLERRRFVIVDVKKNGKIDQFMRSTGDRYPDEIGEVMYDMNGVWIGPARDAGVPDTAGTIAAAEEPPAPDSAERPPSNFGDLI